MAENPYVNTRREDLVAKPAVVGLYVCMTNKKIRAESAADQDSAFMVGINQYVFPVEAPKYAYMTDKEDNAEPVTVQFFVSMEKGDQNA